MRLLLVLALFFATDAAPTGNIARPPNRAFPAIIILKQIYQVNDDGSYTFGYEADDGTYRAENRDNSGYITGKYGYLDSTGSLQEIEYVAGKYDGRSIGYQAKSPSIPVISRDSQGVFPVVKPTSVSAEQKARDYEYNSVDEDHDGIPDKPPNRRTTTTVRPAFTTPKISQQNLRGQSETATAKTGSANMQEIIKMTAESSAMDERKVAVREKEMATSTENSKPEEVIASPAVNMQASKQIVEFPEVGAPALNAGRLVDSDSNLTTAESKVAELKQSLPSRPPTKDVQLSQGSADDEDGLPRGITTGKLEEFLRDLVARAKAKMQNKTPPTNNEKPTVGPAEVQSQSAQDNRVNAETLGFTRII